MTAFTPSDHVYMAEAVRLAQRGRNGVTPNPAVGCVIVRDDSVVGRGWHQRAGEPHAEVFALREAGAAAAGATAYVTMEPCSITRRTPPCTEALIDAGVHRVVYAMRDPNPAVDGRGGEAMRAAGLQVDEGLMAEAASKLNEGFALRMRRGRPFVTLKLGASLDGATAMASGESQWITGPEARRDVQRLRARACAILTGVGTVLADDPSLTVRDPSLGETPRQPLRVVLDSQLRMPTTARVLAAPGETLIIGRRPCEDAAALAAAGARYQPLAGDTQDRVALDSMLRTLGDTEINELLVEAGPTLAGALLDAHLVDRVVVYQAPVLLGSETRGLADTPRWQRLNDGLRLQLEEVRRIGNDLRITARPGEIA
ncbi:MAG: bifunctional diaminohydroxyphosphoribosylaminopyrimidine deaminase/5-amino-6-(5-phosphoribosylamino)uracil reductase RibD [Pseudomonadota bacterium]